MGFERLRADDPRTMPGSLGIAREARTNRLAPGTGKLIVTLLESFCRSAEGGGGGVWGGALGSARGVAVVMGGGGEGGSGGTLF